MVHQNYKLTFENRVANIDGKKWNNKHAISEDGTYSLFGHYLFSFTGGDEEELKDEFISQVDKVLAGANPESIFFDMQVEYTIVEIVGQTARLVENFNGVIKTEELPLQDFRDILQEWYDFMITSPLDGQNME